jgi:hypothetical protein
MVVVTYGTSGPGPVTGTGTASGRRSRWSAGTSGSVIAGKGSGTTAGSTTPVRALVTSDPSSGAADGVAGGGGAAGSTIGESTGGIVSSTPSPSAAARAFARGAAGTAGADRFVIELEEAPRCDDEPRAGASVPAVGVVRRLLRDLGGRVERADASAVSPLPEGGGVSGAPFPDGPSGEGPLPVASPASTG